MHFSNVPKGEKWLQEYIDFCPGRKCHWIFKRLSLPPQLASTSHCWLNKEMDGEEEPSALFTMLPWLSITEPLESQMWSFIQTNAIINYFNKHAYCGISATVAIYISKRPSRIYINASQFTKASHLSGRMVPCCQKTEKCNIPACKAATC